MATAAIVSLGTTLGIKPEATAGGGSYDAAFSTIAEIVSFDGPSVDATMIETTNLSSGQFREYIRGIVGLGELSAQLNMVPTAAVGSSGSRNHYDLLYQLSLDGGYSIANLNAKPPEWLITLPNTAANTWQFFGFVKSFSMSGSIDDPLTMNLTIQVIPHTTTGGISIVD